MTPAARERRLVRTPLLLISAAAWVLLVAAPAGTALATHCAAMSTAGASSFETLDMLLMANPPVSLMAGWAVMLAAMMAPMLIAPVRHIRDRSFSRRRVRAIALFVAGYGAVWMAAGAVLIAMALAAMMGAQGSVVPAVMVAIVALVWQCSPVKQRCLNLCHGHAELAAFGRRADAEVLGFGLAHGVWCVGTCWALMLLPLLVTRGHLAAMAAVTIWLAMERLERPMVPRWQWRGPGKARRIAVARLRTIRI
ncbi:MAG TPA: DUF2182 domain-containing protein [Bryobacteraceae bacterium]|jgi:predicted metal-binding membrane protein